MGTVHQTVRTAKIANHNHRCALLDVQPVPCHAGCAIVPKQPPSCPLDIACHFSAPCSLQSSKKQQWRIICPFIYDSTLIVGVKLGGYSTSPRSCKKIPLWLPKMVLFGVQGGWPRAHTQSQKQKQRPRKNTTILRALIRP